MRYGSNQNNDALVKLNIGGYKYVTTKATLFIYNDIGQQVQKLEVLNSTENTVEFKAV